MLKIAARRAITCKVKGRPRGAARLGDHAMQHPGVSVSRGAARVRR